MYIAQVPKCDSMPLLFNPIDGWLASEGLKYF